MRVVAAPAPFKAALGPADAAAAIAVGARLAGAEVVQVPVADGGEGTLDALVAADGGRIIEAPARDPLGRSITAAFGMLPSGTAVVELAQASGYERLADHERDPEVTTTAGTGDLIRAALDAGCARIIVGVGGSATTDGGLGLAIALGARALDDNDEPLAGIGGALSRVRRVDLSGLDSRLASVQIDVACDVTSPLTGPEGAAEVFGPQKGATPEGVERLEEGLGNLATVLAAQGLPDIADMPRAGAAGGAAGGMLAMLGAVLTDGGALVTRAAGLPAALRGADLCITGEGRLDEQSLHGKVVGSVARLARTAGRTGVRVLVLAGQVDLPVAAQQAAGFQAASVADHAGSVRRAIDDAAAQLAGLAGRVAADLVGE